MQEGNIQLSRVNLISFLDFAAEKGLMKKDTAVSYKKACNIILGILDENEASDLSSITLERVITRHRNLAAGKISPSTLKTYETRTRAAVSNFIEYAKDPSSWRPGIQQRRSRTKATAPSPSTKESKTSAPPIRVGESITVKEALKEPSVHIDFQIHISPETTPEQIDQIFASMRRHLYLNKTSEK